MATAASQSLYPSSTDDGKAIPLDVMSPRELLFVPLVANDESLVTIPANYNVVSIYSTIDAIIDFDNGLAYPPVAGELDNALFLPAGTIMTVQLPNQGAVRVVPVVADEVGYCTIQHIQKWAALGLQRQLGVR